MPKSPTFPKTIIILAILTSVVFSPFQSNAKDFFPHQTGTQWTPFLEWSIRNFSFQGNRFDLIATVTFQHAEGEKRTTEMFYAGDETWKFRFTGTQMGQWTFSTSSDDPDLDRKTGTLTIAPNSNKNAHGFLTQFGNKWGWQGTNEAFVPQLMMYEKPPEYDNNPEKIENDIDTFLTGHGFNGFHTMVFMRWFDFDQERYDDIHQDDPNPDFRTFDALELLITKTHAAGGMVHLWVWGDEQRHMTPIKWRINGKTDRRLQRYMAARLGPLPGWSMGYGFDLFEWVKEKDLREWHEYMHEHLGWHHFLGGRSGGPRKGTDHGKWQIYEGLDYSAYEHHRPTYEVYVAALEARKEKPSFSEDRFRIRQSSIYKDKDYNEVMTRRGLWHSAMAGGVANIWGYMIGAPSAASLPYPHKEWIKTNALFFQTRFLKEMIRDNQITDGVCLKHPGNHLFVFYKEGTDSIQMDLTGMNESQPAVAVDTKKAYREIDIGILASNESVWKAPYRSDWAVAVGKFKPHTNQKSPIQ